MQVTEIERHLDDMAQLSLGLGGCLSEREARFLSLAAATLPPSLGDVLETGRIKSNSTTLLAKSVSLAGGKRIYAVDPLISSSFGPCGICGSIGWAQYLGSSPKKLTPGSDRRDG